MKLINTKLHGWLDYVVGFIIMISPWLFGFDRGRTETQVALCAGAAIIVYSLFTNYEMGVLHHAGIPTRAHLVLDVLAGIFLAAAPWIFGFSDYVMWPFVSFGIIDLCVALTTDSVAYSRIGTKQPNTGKINKT